MVHGAVGQEQVVQYPLLTVTAGIVIMHNEVEKTTKETVMMKLRQNLIVSKISV